MNGNYRRTAKSKIAFLSFQVLGTTGSRFSWIGMSKGLAELGDQVDFFGVRSKRVLVSTHKNMRILAIPLRFVPFMTHMSYLILLILMLPFYVALRRPDFVVMEPKFGSLILAFESKLFVPQIRPKMILDIRSTPVEVITLRRSMGALAFNVSVLTATKVFDGITVATSQMKEEICRRFQLSPRLIQVWHNGVDVDLFRPQKFDGKDVRKILGLSNRFVVFYHGAFRLSGGVVETIKSVQILKEKYPNLILFLLGSGPALQFYKNVIRESRIEDRVVIHEAVGYSDVPKYIAMANVGIVPLPNISDWKNQSPLKLIEYLAMGKTVIATDIPANRELTGEEKCAIYISGANPEAIARAMSYAYDNREKLEAWGALGRTIVKQEYDWKTVAQDFEKHLHEFASADKLKF